MNLKSIKRMLAAGVLIASMQASSAHAVLAGVKTLGMAATSTAYPIDALCGAYNPAGIALVGNRIDAGISWANTHGTANVKDLPTYQAAPFPSVYAVYIAGAGLPQPSTFNGVRNGAKTSNAYVPEFGIVKHFSPQFCGGKFDFAASMLSYNRNYLKTTYGQPFTLFGNTPTGLELVQQTLCGIIAARYCKMHTFAVGLNYNIQRLKVNGLQTFATPAFSVEPTRATNKGYSYSNGIGVVLGYMFQYKGLQLGASWQPKTTMRKFARYAGFIASRGSFDYPMRYQLGISYQFACRLALAFDYEYVKWQGIPMLKNPTFPNLLIGGDPPLNPDYKLGTKNGAGFGFYNQHFYRFGGEYKINDCFTVRAGFRHANTPVRPEFTAINLLTLDTMQNVWTMGFTWNINPCNEISMFYAYGGRHHVRGKDSVPAYIPSTNPATGARFNYPVNVDVANSPSAGLNPATAVADKGELNVMQRICVLGVSWGRKF